MQAQLFQRNLDLQPCFEDLVCEHPYVVHDAQHQESFLCHSLYSSLRKSKEYIVTIILLAFILIILGASRELHYYGDELQRIASG